MRRALLPLIGLVCALALLLYGYRRVLFADEQFAFRDATHFHYPLQLRVQQEWEAGRWPLWDPGQNGGTPLLGYPMAAVLYPGKIVYALLPFAWANRLYTIAHTIVAFAGMLALARSLGVGGVGSCLSALSYAFGAPVLFQYCNVIYLVGAAWAPWGFRAMDRLIRLRRPGGVAELALCLALQTLGGDPEAAYLTAVCGGVYAVVLALGAVSWPRWLQPRRFWVLVGSAVLLLWIVLVLGAGWLLPRRERPGWLPSQTMLQALAWGGACLAVLRSDLGRRRRQASRAVLGPALAGLAGAGLLAGALAGAQLLPTLEFSALSDRAVPEQPLSALDFSVEPYRLVELAWPNAFGTLAPENRLWLQAIPPRGTHQLWTHSLYLGCLTLGLALGGAAGREAPPWRAWFVVVAAVSLAASCGRHASPLWWVRWLPGAWPVLGPHDSPTEYFRPDAYLDDGFGSPYGLLAAVLPGFAVFRYPGKLLTFFALSVSVLAGLGWDLLASGRTRWPARWCGWGLVGTLAVLALWTAVAPSAMGPFLAARQLPDPEFGPIEIPAALDATRRSLIHGAIALGLGLGLTTLARRRPGLAGGAALVVLSLDLGLANSGLIRTIPQAVFDAPSQVARLIEAHERKEPSSNPRPFRIHRMQDWMPNDFARKCSPRRLGDLAAWQRDTLDPLFGVALGLQYGLVKGNLELLDYLVLFRTTTMPVRGTTAAFLAVPDGTMVLYIPRRAFDLWNNRYFIVPMNASGWASRERGFAPLLPETELIHPSHAEFSAVGPGSWREGVDWMILKNQTAFPRAWLVHSVRVRPEVSVPRLNDLPDDERLVLLQDLLYANDAFWSDPARPVFDLHQTAFVETTDRSGLTGFVGLAPVEPAETVTITKYEPQRVELTAVLNHPGLVILADTFYPGWRLAIDGVRAPIYRTNHAMRGAAVRAGTHRLVYTYEPHSFRFGLWLSLAGALGMAALVAGTAIAARRPLKRLSASGTIVD